MESITVASPEREQQPTGVYATILLGTCYSLNLIQIIHVAVQEIINNVLGKINILLF